MVKFPTIILLILFSFTFATASSFGYGIAEDDTETFGYDNNPTASTFDNSTAFVNNSQYLRGYSPTGLRDLFQTTYDTIYCKLTGCTMTGDIDMGGNDITNVGTITATNFIGIVEGLWESPSSNSQLIIPEDINLQNKNINNVENITINGSINHATTDSKAYFDINGTFVVEG